MLLVISEIARIIWENIYLFILILNFLFGLVIIFREKKQASSTWAWLLVLTFLPIVGFILYLFLGRGIANTRLFDLKIQNNIGALRMIYDQQSYLQEEQLPNPPTAEVDARPLIYMLLKEKSIYAQYAKLELFTDGKEKFARLMEDIRHATHHVHIEYYIFKMDGLGKELYHELMNARKRGVEIRVLLDSWGSNGVNLHDFKELTDIGGEVVFFFPLFLPWVNPRLNYRNHRKIAVIDGKIGYTGGFNVGDEYLGKSKKFGYWRDNHLRFTGESVYSLQNRFIMDWNSQHHNEVKNPAFYFPKIEDKGNVHMQIVTSGPDSQEEQVKMTYLKMIMMAKKEILIQTPYYIPGESLHEALKIALLSGIKVHLQIPNKPDHPLVYWATYSFAAELVKYGAIVETYENGFIHSKTIVIDAGIVTVGSTNIDNRSFQLDFEVNAVIYDATVAQEIRNAFFEDSKLSKQLTLELYEQRSRMIHFKESLARLISPLL